MRKAASRICRERLSTLTSHATRKRLPVRRTSLRGQVQREWMAPCLRFEATRGSYAVSRVNVAVAVADDAQSRIYEVAAACRALGLAHTSTLATVGVLTGSMESDELAKLFAVPGVLAVEVEYRFRPGTTGMIQ